MLICKNVGISGEMDYSSYWEVIRMPSHQECMNMTGYFIHLMLIMQISIVIGMLIKIASILSQMMGKKGKRNVGLGALLWKMQKKPLYS